jgi:hypothetical protein
MKDIIAALFISSALAGITSSAFAGEDSTDRWHGVGPAYYETEGGLRRFAECAGTQEPQPAAVRDCANARASVAGRPDLHRGAEAEKNRSNDSQPKNPAREEGV